MFLRGQIYLDDTADPTPGVNANNGNTPVLSKLSSPVADSVTRSTIRLHLVSVRNRTWRVPPVSAALALTTPSIPAVQCTNDEGVTPSGCLALVDPYRP